jgi:hypothetical protein
MAPRLVLRTCNSVMTSHGGFVWPTEGKVVAPDWNPAPECGGGLHGLLNGQGDATLLNWDADARWLVVKPGQLLVDLDGKVKFKTGTVKYCGDRPGALAYLRANGVTDPLPGEQVTAGYWGTATAGYEGTATAGNRGIIVIKWGDGGRYRLTVGYCGEKGIKANTPYRCNNRGELVEVTS